MNQGKPTISCNVDHPRDWPCPICNPQGTQMSELDKCQLCKDGVKLVGKDHWIVKSIIPAKIKIVPCKALRALAKAECVAGEKT